MNQPLLPGESDTEVRRMPDEGHRPEPSSLTGERPRPHLRGVQERSLTPAAHEWLAKQPPRYQPMATARLHPHIVNRFAALWDQASPLGAYFHELLLATRKGRTGFSLGVLTEITDLDNLRRETLHGGAGPQVSAGGGSLCAAPSLQLVYETKRKIEPACERIADQRR